MGTTRGFCDRQIRQAWVCITFPITRTDDSLPAISGDANDVSIHICSSKPGPSSVDQRFRPPATRLSIQGPCCRYVQTMYVRRLSCTGSLTNRAPDRSSCRTEGFYLVSAFRSASCPIRIFPIRLLGLIYDMPIWRKQSPFSNMLAAVHQPK